MKQGPAGGAFLPCEDASAAPPQKSRRDVFTGSLVQMTPSSGRTCGGIAGRAAAAERPLPRAADSGSARGPSCSER